MAVSDVNQLQMVLSSSTTSFNDLIDSQKELIQSQIEHLQNLVVAQCKLTGVNPLSQEMVCVLHLFVCNVCVSLDFDSLCRMMFFFRDCDMIVYGVLGLRHL